MLILPVRTFLASPYVFTILPPLFWAGNAVVGRALVGDVPPLALSVLRWALALAVILPIGWPRLKPVLPEVKRRWPLFLALSVLSVTAYNTLLYVAVETTTAINATLVSTAMPVTIAVLSWAWLGEKLGPKGVAGVAVSLVGVLVVVTRGDAAMLLALQFNRGDVVMMVATLAWAIYSVMLRRYKLDIDPIAQLTVQIALGLAVLFPLALIDGALGNGIAVTAAGLASQGWETLIPALAYLGVFPSLVAYYFWSRGVAALGATVAGLYIYLIPVFTAFLAVALLGEELRWYHLLGLVLIGGGMRLTSMRGKSQ